MAAHRALPLERGALLKNPNFGAAAPAHSSASALDAAAESGRVVLSNRALTSFPAGILTVGAASAEWWLVESVKHLDLSFNPLLRRLPPEVAQLAPSLAVLKLRGCGLAALPEELCQLLGLRFGFKVGQNNALFLPRRGMRPVQWTRR